MKKLKLDLDTLDVESFAAGAAELPMEGTVQAHSEGVVLTVAIVVAISFAFC